MAKGSTTRRPNLASLVFLGLCILTQPQSLPTLLAEIVASLVLQRVTKTDHDPTLAKKGVDLLIHVDAKIPIIVE